MRLPARLSSPRSSHVMIVAILALAASLRLLYITQIPPGLYSDEATAGYTAYSLLRTGRDTTGMWLPIFSRSFGFGWSNFVGFLLVPSIMLLGLNEFAVRAPFAIMGVATVLLVYLVVKKHTHNPTALWAAFLLAISPWHVHQSRYCNDTTLMTFLFVLGLYFFYNGLRGRSLYFYLSSATFGITTYTYLSARIFIPLIGVGLLYIYRKDLAPRSKTVKKSLLLFLIILLPTIIFALREPQCFFIRYKQIGVTSANKSYADGVFLFIKNYLSHLSPIFIFLKGDANYRNFPNGFGQIYLFELPLVAIGLIACMRSWKNADARFLIFWLLTYGIPASLTVENIPHCLRASTAIPLYEILAAIGISWGWRRVRSLGGWQRGMCIRWAWIFAALAVANICAFFHHYIYRYPVYASVSWDYGWREVMHYAISAEDRYDHIVLTVLSIGTPTMYPPFYLQYDPAEYQRSKLKKSKYLFVPPKSMSKLLSIFEGRTLCIVREQELLRLPVRKEIYFPDGTMAFKIVDMIKRSKTRSTINSTTNRPRM